MKRMRESSFHKELGQYESWQAFDEYGPDDNSVKNYQGADGIHAAMEMLKEGRLYYWSKHYETLSEDLKRSLDDGTHPSLSHDQEGAQEYLDAFSDHLERVCDLSITKKPTMDLYHGDQIVFSLRVDSELSWAEIDQQIPSYFKGFRILRYRESDLQRLKKK